VIGPRFSLERAGEALGVLDRHEAVRKWYYTSLDFRLGRVVSYR
jgi:hypothetical protein